MALLGSVAVPFVAPSQAEASSVTIQSVKVTKAEEIIVTYYYGSQLLTEKLVPSSPVKHLATIVNFKLRGKYYSYRLSDRFQNPNYKSYGNQLALAKSTFASGNYNLADKHLQAAERHLRLIKTTYMSPSTLNLANTTLKNLAESIAAVKGNSTSVTGKPVIIANSGVTVVDNQTIRIVFNTALESASVLNKDNYALSDGVISNVLVISENTVELKLAVDSIVTSGSKVLQIKNITSTRGFTMDPAARTVEIKENVAPKMLSANLPYTDKIYVQFSEPIKAEGLTGTDDFVIMSDGTLVSYARATQSTDQPNTVILELQSPVTALTNIQISVRKGATVLTDGSGNPVIESTVGVFFGK